MVMKRGTIIGMVLGGILIICGILVLTSGYHSFIGLGVVPLLGGIFIIIAFIVQSIRSKIKSKN